MDEQEARRLKKELKKSKKRKLSELSEILPAVTAPVSEKQTSNASATSVIEYPYDVVDDDHCETPVEAYQDIVSFLQLCATRLHKTNDQLAIYDPFYCEGNVKVRLASLGFTNVYNEKEDFYAVQTAGKCPDFDVLLTNPPYSGSHMERLLDFCARVNKPCCLLVPNYVYMKDYFTRHRQMFFFITPNDHRRYLYTTPKVSPFFWQHHCPNNVLTVVVGSKTAKISQDHFSLSYFLVLQSSPSHPR